MKKHICKNPNCGKIYNYCRGCLISPILYKELGFCSQKCHDEFKNQKIKEVVHQDVEVVITDRDISTSE